MTAHLLPVLRERCPYCSRFVSPFDIIPIGTGGAKMCLRCYEWHEKALMMFVAKASFECQECHVTPQELILLSASGNVVLRVHTKDGIYQVLCEKCSDAYERKRLDLYGDTVYGHAKNLQGAH